MKFLLVLIILYQSVYIVKSCNKEMDLILIVDETIRDQNTLDIVKLNLIDFINRQETSNNTVNLGLITLLSGELSLIKNLNEKVENSLLIGKINSLKLSSKDQQKHNLATAFRFSRFLDKKSNLRSIVLISTGDYSDNKLNSLHKVANIVKKRFNLFAIDVQQRNSFILKQLVSKSDFLLNSFKELAQKIPILMQTSCIENLNFIRLYKTYSKVLID